MWRKIGARYGALTVVAVGALACAADASAAGTRTVAPVRPPAPSHERVVRPFVPLGGRLGNDTVASTNWSGYAVQSSGLLTDAQGSWTEPSVTCSSSGAQYASFWAGIDGYSSDSVEQLGTDSDCTGRNRPSYYAWWELYPASSVELPTSTYPVKAGDKLSAEVSVSATTFTLTLKSSEGWTFTTTQVESGLAQSSAELIAESPEICSFTCRLASLSDFGTVNFTGADAAVSGGADSPFSAFTADSGPHEIIAETSNRTIKAQPSALNGNAFSITWKHS
jgi:hypothetical protein